MRSDERHASAHYLPVSHFPDSVLTQFRTSAGYLHFPGSDIRSRRRALDKARSSCLVTNGGPLPDDRRTVAVEELFEIVHA
jgi:hypothetical protein